MKLIGIAGTLGSGKDTLADYLVDKKGFIHISTGDLVREESMKRHGSIERNPYLQETATYLRRKFGGDILIEKGLKKLNDKSNKSRKVVFTGIRSLGEARGIKKKGGTLIYVDAPIEVRYERMKKRRRDQEALVSIEEFKQSELNEQTKSDDDAEFNIYKIKYEADVVIQNDGSKEDFMQQAKELLREVPS